MALNKRLLRKVRNRIAKIPESYDQESFCAPTSKAPCGAAACLAGKTIIVASPSIKEGIERLKAIFDADDGDWDDLADAPVAQEAAIELGLTDEESEAMFDGEGDGWPEPYRTDFQESLRSERPQVAVAYLDECLKRGKVTW